MAGLRGQQYIFGHVEHEQGAHPVIGEALPHLGGEQKGKPAGMAEELAARGTAVRLGRMEDGRGVFSQGPPVPFSFPAIVSIRQLVRATAQDPRNRRIWRFAGLAFWEKKRVTKFGIGQPVHRLEDPRFITGRGRYVDDIECRCKCYGVLVMSPHAHAHIAGIDTPRRRRLRAFSRCSPAPMPKPIRSEAWCR